MRMLSKVLFGTFLLLGCVLYAQNETAAIDSTPTNKTQVKDSVSKKRGPRIKADGIAAVVGDYIILQSDVERAIAGLKSQGSYTADMTNCRLLGKLMEDKLYMHSAVQDSVEVTQVEIRGGVERRMEYFLQQVEGDMTKLLEIYGYETEGELREELTTVVKEQLLTDRMREEITQNIEVTPEEVSDFFYSIPEDERPEFGASVELSQIVVKPEIPQEENEKVKERLLKMKEDVEDNGASFTSKVILYSEDPGKRQSPSYTITRKSQFVKEFKDAAFSLQEGQVSEPFESQFGWHILYVAKIRGEQREVQHVLLRPYIPQSSLREAKAKIDSIRQLLIDNKISFEEAAKSYSDEKETKYDGGRLINPQTLDLKFELARMDPSMFNIVNPLKQGELSQPIFNDQDARGVISYKIIKVNKKTETHTADFENDYPQVKELALKNKQLKEIQKWVKDKIKDTFVDISPDNRDCEFGNNWLKTE